MHDGIFHDIGVTIAIVILPIAIVFFIYNIDSFAAFSRISRRNASFFVAFLMVFYMLLILVEGDHFIIFR